MILWLTGHHSYLIFCDLRDNMPRQRSLLSSLTFPTQLVLKEGEDFPRSGKYFNDVSLLT